MAEEALQADPTGGHQACPDHPDARTQPYQGSQADGIGYRPGNLSRADNRDCATTLCQPPRCGTTDADNHGLH